MPITVRPGNGNVTVNITGGGTTRVTLDKRTVANIQGNRPLLQPTVRPGPILLPASNPSVQAGGAMGVQGPKGDAGTSETVSLPVGAVINGHTVVRAVDGVVYPVDTAVPEHASQVIGVALQSVTVLGQPLEVRPVGTITESNWNWPAGLLFCAADGQLTQTPPDTGWLLQVGRVLSPTQIDVAIQPPIQRG